MKIDGVSSAAPAAAARRPGAAAPGFTLGEAPAAAVAARASATVATAAFGSLDALMALQGAPDAMERRRRARQRADALLDVLDEVRIGLLDGRMPTAALSRLSQTLAQKRETSDDPALDALLDEIEVRAEVERAKLERSLR